jgi:hypothetical protein
MFMTEDVPAGIALTGKPLIHRKIIEVMRAVGPVAKAGHYKDNQTEYNYRRADDVFDALHGALAEAGIYPKPIVREVSREWGQTKGGTPRMQITLKITYRLTAEDGSFEDVDLEVDNWNTSDKGIGAAMTVALRIALLQVFVIPTGDVDPDAIREEATGGAQPLSTALTQYLLHAVKEWPLERLEEAWRLLTAHVPGAAQVPGTEAPIVWWEVFAERYVAEVEACLGKDDLAALWTRLKGFGLGFLVGGGVSVADLITKRATTLAAENKAALQESRDLIAAATDEAEIAHASEVVKAHLAAHRISAADSMLFLEQIAGKRDEIREDPDPDADPADLPSYEGR